VEATNSTEEVREFKLHRTGDRPLAFSGLEVAVAESLREGRRHQPRWFTLALYKTQSGKLIGYRHFSTEWKDEKDLAEAKVFETLEEAAIWFRDWSPKQLDGIGYPPTMPEKQERLLGTLTADYRAAVSELLGETESVERVE
jgi:hypothetical protein